MAERDYYSRQRYNSRYVNKSRMRLLMAKNNIENRLANPDQLVNGYFPIMNDQHKRALEIELEVVNEYLAILIDFELVREDYV